MGAYWIREVDGNRYAEVLRYLNQQEPVRFPALEQKHLDRGYWWLASTDNKTIVGFAGMVPMTPFDAGYLKRAYVTPAHRGNGIQLQFMKLREAKAKSIGWTLLVTEVGGDNSVSAANLVKSGFTQTVPEQFWGPPGSIYFAKRL